MFCKQQRILKKGCRNTADKTQFTLQKIKTSECWKPWQEGSKSNATNYSLWAENYIFWKSSSQKAHPWVLGCHTSQHIIYNIVGDGVHDTHIMFELGGVVWWQVQDIPRSDPAGDRYIKGYRPVCLTPPSGPHAYRPSSWPSRAWVRQFFRHQVQLSPR